MDYTDFLVDRAQHMRPLEYDLSENFNELVRYLHDIGMLNNLPVGTIGQYEIITASDALSAPLRSLVVYGNSVQDGTPTPDAPVEIKSVENPVLTFAGRNLFDSSLLLRAAYSSFDGEYYTVSGYRLNQAFPLNNGGFPVPIYGHQAVLSFDGFNANGDASAGLNFIFLYTNNTRDVVRVNTVTLAHYSLVSNPSKTLKALGFSYNSNYDAKLKNIQLELGSTATDYEPYEATTVTIPVTLRSLPDGTKDTLALTYLRPSTREGWAWYSGEVTRRTTTEVINGSETNWWKSTSYAGGYYRRAWASNRGISRTTNHLQDRFATVASTSDYAVGTCLIDESLNFRVDNDLYPTLADFKAWLVENPVTIQYPLATPTTETLPEIELPVLPAPNVTIWATAAATPTLAAEYVRDIGAAINDMQEAIADI